MGDKIIAAKSYMGRPYVLLEDAEPGSFSVLYEVTEYENRTYHDVHPNAVLVIDRDIKEIPIEGGLELSVTAGVENEGICRIDALRRFAAISSFDYVCARRLDDGRSYETLEVLPDGRKIMRIIPRVFVEMQSMVRERSSEDLEDSFGDMEE